MSSIPLDVDEARLIEICKQRWAESQTLDFKRGLPASLDKEALLKDVCAFANADGGDLIYGIDEDNGTAKAISAIAAEPVDAAKRRLGQIIDAGIEPRIAGLRFQDVAVSGGYVLIVRVPASFNGPHCYKVNDARRFVMRNDTHTAELTYQQLRNAFDRTATLAERTQRFRADRVDALSHRKTWKTMIPGPLCVVHFIPISAMAGGVRVDIQTIYHDFSPYVFNEWQGASRSTNLDGLIAYASAASSGQLLAYTQVYRSGALEAVRIGGGLLEPAKKLIPSTVVSRYFRDAIKKLLAASRTLGFSGPAIIGLSLIGISDYQFGVGDRIFGIDMMRADRDHLVLPETWLDSIEAPGEIDDVARPLLNMLWQAFDIERCLEYSSEGIWQPR